MLFVVLPWVLFVGFAAILGASGLGTEAAIAASLSTIVPVASLVFLTFARVPKPLTESPVVKHLEQQESTKRKLQERIAMLSKIRNEEASLPDQDRAQTRIDLITASLASFSKKLVEIEAQERGRLTARWLNKLEELIWDVRQLSTISQEHFDELLIRLANLRKEGESTLIAPAPLHTAQDPSLTFPFLAGADAAVGEGMSKLQSLEQYLRDRRVLEAVGQAALEEPDFLQSTTTPSWNMPLYFNSASLEELDSLDKDGLYEMKGLLRVSGK